MQGKRHGARAKEKVFSPSIAYKLKSIALFRLIMRITFFQECLCSFRRIFRCLDRTHDQIDKTLTIRTGNLHRLSEILFMCPYMERGDFGDVIVASSVARSISFS